MRKERMSIEDDNYLQNIAYYKKEFQQKMIVMKMTLLTMIMMILLNLKLGTTMAKWKIQRCFFNVSD